MILTLWPGAALRIPPGSRTSGARGRWRSAGKSSGCGAKPRSSNLNRSIARWWRRLRRKHRRWHYCAAVLPAAGRRWRWHTYKAVNTLDSMVGYKHGKNTAPLKWSSAPALMSGELYSRASELAAVQPRGVVMSLTPRAPAYRLARSLTSTAKWSEASVAGALGIRLQPE